MKWPAAWSPECWTARYVWDRIRSSIYRARHPELPWLPAAANELLATLLPKEGAVLEIGAGSSTRFFLSHGLDVYSLEEDPAWRRRVENALSEKERAGLHWISSLDAVEANSMNMVLVDGGDRLAAAWAGWKALCPGACLILDNSNRYLPSSCAGPGTRGPWTAEDEGEGTWHAWLECVGGSRQEIRGNGVTETRFFHKPGHS